MTTATAPRPTDTAPERESGSLIVYFLIGTFLGTIFIKSEVASWFRIQEMFRFQAFHMYGVIGSAVLTGVVTTLLMKRVGVRTVRGEEIGWPQAAEARPAKRHILGGTAFGLGWGLLGACPGPLFALIGAGYWVFGIGLLGAVAGAWTYGLSKPNLPH